jgi:hypothetical protein
MRRPRVFLLLLVAFAASVSGCGTKEQDPEGIVQSWSQAINAGDDEAAAALFADGAVVIQAGRRTTLTGQGEARAFNASLPCGGEIVEQSLDGDEVTATFTLTGRRAHRCTGTGETAVALFRIADGKIVLWHQLPTPESATETA